MYWPENKASARQACICFFVSVLCASMGGIYSTIDPWPPYVGHVIGAGCLMAWVSFIVWTFFWTVGHVEAGISKDTRPCSVKP